MRRILLLAVVLTCGSLPVTRPQEKMIMPSEQELELLNLINTERRKKGIAPVMLNAILMDVARAHSANMAKQRKLQHKLDDKSPYDRIKEAGYKYSVAAENLARGDVTLPELVQGWMKSKAHRENILDADFKDIGIGVVSDGHGETYYTHVFGAPEK